MDNGVGIEGVSELTKSLTELAAKFPDAAGTALRKEARNVRKKITTKAGAKLKSSGNSKKSLLKDSSYRISMLKGYGANQYVEISAKSPHYHLVERGHRQVTESGRDVGFVEGRFFLEEAVKEYEPELEQAAERMLEKLLKESGLE